MCTGHCAKFIGVSLYPFCVICIICNILLFFPGWTLDAIQNPSEKLTPEVLYLGGLMGNGVMVLVPAIYIQCTGRRGKCNNRCGMFISIILAGLGVCGAVYGFIVSLLGLVNGPRCLYQFINGRVEWAIPFKMEKEFVDLDSSYLYNRVSWTRCVEPTGVVEFNVILFSTIVAASAIQVVLCLSQMINGLFGCICGTCRNKM
ncbi:transmembrane 4 L6 family member 5-like [Spea bombifrons]|uniref:transmembrane 4 L6 family member 5-like n=1 Tax=Spea bombifrons TaxID=233779 RepID=UPI00234B0BAC|nr:transmembrane 4 L6 family member 5-like [Spea bombifrons]XP_053318869.1 transmembrane 4 L6 family member 5-like [Spea bombifrons]XP_053318870.1 transmembrane 4 L6 family member 5-like [Spea bombifrons]